MSCDNLIKMLFLTSSKLWEVLYRSQACLMCYCKSSRTSHPFLNVGSHCFPHNCPYWRLHIFPNLSTLNSSWISFDYHSEIWQNFSDQEPHWKRKWIRPWCGLIFANLTLVTITALLSHCLFHLRLVLSYRPCSDRILSGNFPDQLSHSSSLGGFVLCSIALWDDLNHNTYHDGCFCLSYYTRSSLKMGT